MKISSLKMAVILCLLGFCFSTAACLTTAPQGSAKSCYDCHKKARADFAKPFTHPSVAAQDCEACHKRHGFSNKLVLKEKGSALCYSCHKGLKEKMEKKTMHEPVRKGECTACHDPHASDRRELLRETPDKSLLCFTCHPALKPVK
jgi:predicted CXXCH cytochrome family protein